MKTFKQFLAEASNADDKIKLLRATVKRFAPYFHSTADFKEKKTKKLFTFHISPDGVKITDDLIKKINDELKKNGFAEEELAVSANYTSWRGSSPVIQATVNLDNLTEADDNVTIFTNLSAAGSSLVKAFTDEESADILDALKSNPAAHSKLEDFVYSAEDEDERYSETIVIRANGKRFTLYAANAQLRIGGGGDDMTSKRVLMGISAEDLIKWLPSARIKSK